MPFWSKQPPKLTWIKVSEVDTRLNNVAKHVVGGPKIVPLKRPMLQRESGGPAGAQASPQVKGAPRPKRPPPRGGREPAGEDGFYYDEETFEDGTDSEADAQDENGDPGPSESENEEKLYEQDPGLVEAFLENLSKDRKKNAKAKASAERKRKRRKRRRNPIRAT